MKERAELLFTGLYGRVFDVEERETGFTVRGAAPFISWEPGGGPPRAIGYLRIAVDITLYDGFAIIALQSDNDYFIPPDNTGYKVAKLNSKTYLVLDQQDKWPAYVAYGDLLIIALNSANLITPRVFSTRWAEDAKVLYTQIYHQGKCTVFTVGHSAVKLPDNYRELIFYPLKVR